MSKNNIRKTIDKQLIRKSFAGAIFDIRLSNYSGQKISRDPFTLLMALDGYMAQCFPGASFNVDISQENSGDTPLEDLEEV